MSANPPRFLSSRLLLRPPVPAAAGFAFCVLIMLMQAALLAALGGCATARDESLASPDYPSLQQTETVNVQVFKDETTITLTNTTGRALPKGRMWLNQWFAKAVDEVPVGATATHRLSDFRDKYGDAFREGGFFRADAGTALVQAQIETPAPEPKLIGLIVVAAKGT